MTLHLQKLCVGAHTVDDLDAWVRLRVARNKKLGRGAVHDHVTRMFPKRREDLLDGGSLYWVIKGVILVRQRIIDLVEATGQDGVRRCEILLEPPLIPVTPQPRRAFQGWRYLPSADAPADLSAGADDDAPPALRAELAELGLL
ncbi:MAG: DUF1489 domain-containing protein [Pseudomonadota bacterium]